MRNSVLFVCEGKQHLTFAITLAETLHQAEIQSILFYPHALPEPAMVTAFKFVTNDQLAIPGLLQHIGLVVMFTNESSPFCMSSNRVGFIAKKTNTPVVTIQHGWLQPGYNFETALQTISFSNSLPHDSSRAIWHFSDVIGYFGENGIGFPGMRATDAPFRRPASQEINVLVATNFNWGIYSKENIVGFLRALRELGQRFPSTKLLHRGHPSESNKKINDEIGFYMNIAGIETGEWQGPSEALAWADIVISTPSTFVLDALSERVPTFVYRTKAFGEHMAPMENISFSTPNQLVRLMNELVTSFNYETPDVPPFNQIRFISEIKSRMNEVGQFQLDEEDFLNYTLYLKM